jgi:hypothetical protein
MTFLKIQEPKKNQRKKVETNLVLNKKMEDAQFPK